MTDGARPKMARVSDACRYRSNKYQTRVRDARQLHSDELFLK